MGLATRNALEGSVADAATLLADPDLRAAERITAAAIRLDEALTGRDAWTEADLANLAALSRHQARQAVAGLKAAGMLERVYPSRSDGARPAPVYVWRTAP